MRLHWPGMRYTKLALLLFGLGLIAGFVAVVFEVPQAERPSAVVMALGLILTPVGLFADGRGFVLLRWAVAKFSRRKPPLRAKPRAARKPAAPKKAAAKAVPKPAAAGSAKPRPRQRSTPSRPRRKRR